MLLIVVHSTLVVVMLVAARALPAQGRAVSGGVNGAR